MRPYRIQLSGVTIALLILLSGASFLLPKQSIAQCPPGTGTLQTETHSVTLTSSGTNTYTLTLPQFNPNPGGYTLLSAVFSSYATTTSTINFQNNNTSEQDFTPNVSRNDVIKLNGTTITGGGASYNGYNFTALAPHGSPGDNVTYGPNTIYNNTQIVNSSVTDAGTLNSSYTGGGDLNLTYTANFFINNVQTGVIQTPVVTDNITFSVTYNYCNPLVLSVNVITFTATQEPDQTVALNWITADEQPGRRYDIEVSTDGSNYTIAGSKPSDPVNSETSYFYSYPIPYGTTGKLFFRLRQVEADGKFSYSPIRIIDLGAGSASGFSIYPNPPSGFLNLLFPSTTRGWQVDILAADGSLVQRNYYNNTNYGRLNFQRVLSSGAYFARATNLQTVKSYVASFVIR